MADHCPVPAEAVTTDPGKPDGSDQAADQGQSIIKQNGDSPKHDSTPDSFHSIDKDSPNNLDDDLQDVAKVPLPEGDSVQHPGDVGAKENVPVCNGTQNDICSTDTPCQKDSKQVNGDINVVAQDGECHLSAEAQLAHKRSVSDSAMKDIAGSVNSNGSPVPERARSHSDSDDRAAALRARINEKFDQLEREMKVQTANSSSSSSPTTEGPDNPAVMHLSDSFEGVSPSESNVLGDDLCVLNSGSPAAMMIELRGSDSKRPRSVSVAEVKELAYARLQAELRKAQQELKLKDEEVVRLSQIRDEVGKELEELTASLFEEANNMVREANIKQATAEKRLKEANLKIEVLQAEVQALKTLMITSTPSRPNPHLHPQIDSKTNGVRSFLKGGHKRSPSNYELSRKGPPSPPSSPLPEEQNSPLVEFTPEKYEIDPVYHKEFVSWRQSPKLDREHPFLARIYKEDIMPCLHFSSQELTLEVLSAIEDNSIIIEAVSGKNPFPKKCSLLDAPRLCKYRMKFGDSLDWHYISQLCRNRIISVCDFFCYLRYIQQGLVRNGIHEVYWEIVKRRREMCLARLGICPP